MKIEDNNFVISYNDKEYKVIFSGSLRLKDLNEFEKIYDFLVDIYDLETNELTLDFVDLDFMNSAGISTLCKFIFKVKEGNEKSLTIVGRENFLWQRKSFTNLQVIDDRIKLIFLNK